MDLLMSAKKQQLIAEGVPNPPEVTVRKAISRMEAATHCCQRTNGKIRMKEMLEQLILSFSTATDTMSVPLLKDEMPSIREEQKPHVKCLQDPPGSCNVKYNYYTVKYILVQVLLTLFFHAFAQVFLYTPSLDTLRKDIFPCQCCAVLVA